MNIYVGNLSFDTREQSVRTLFEQYGAVDSAKLIADRDTGRLRGFGFVEMPNDSDGRKAISALDGTDLDGRSLKVNESRPRESRGGGGRNDRW